MEALWMMGRTKGQRHPGLLWRWGLVLGWTGWILGLGGGPAWGADLRIGVVDTQRVLDESRVGQQIKAELEAHVKSRQQIIDLEEAELKRMQEEIQQKAGILSQEALQAKEAAFQRKLGEYQRKVIQLQQEVETKKAEKIREFNEHLLEATREVARARGLDLVLARDPETSAVLYVLPALDITEAVIQAMDRKLPSRGEGGS